MFTIIEDDCSARSGGNLLTRELGQQLGQVDVLHT